MLWLFIPAIATQVNAAEIQPKVPSVLAAADTATACPQPVLSRLKSHKVTSMSAEGSRYN